MALTFSYHRFIYRLQVYQVEISYRLVDIVAAFDAKCTEFDPSLKRYIGGRSGGLNLKNLSDLHDVGHFINTYICVFKMVKSLDQD